MSLKLIEQFFNSKQGEAFHREAINENIDERKELVKQNKAFREQMKELLTDKNVIKAKSRCTRIEKELKEAIEELGICQTVNYEKRTKLEKEIKKNKIILEKTAPSYVSSCYSIIFGLISNGDKKTKEKSTLLKQHLGEIKSWFVLSMPYDDMKNQFNKMLSETNNMD